MRWPSPRRAAAVGAILLIAVSIAVAARPGGGGGALSISDASVREADGRAVTLTFTVTLTGARNRTVKVAYATVDGTAAAPDDFARASGSLVLGGRDRTGRVTVRVAGDNDGETDELLAVRLSRPSGARIVDGSGLGTVRDDDGLVLSGTRIAAAGDIACDPANPSFTEGRGFAMECRQLATSDVLLRGNYAAVLALGDVQYEDATLAKFGASYDRSWGRAKPVTRPVPGNHEFGTPDATGYFEYFGQAAGDPTLGYYSFEIARWHLIALNSNCDAVGGCGPGSEQERWLRRDLAAHASAACTLAFWHHPRFSSGEHGSDATYTAFWQALYEAGVDVVLAGHDHDYERFAPQTPNGALDPARGLREFVVGTGGRSLRAFRTVRTNSQRRDASSFGVLELTLGVGAYAWRFVPALGSLTDSGSETCH